MTNEKPYPNIDSSPDFPKLEEEVLSFWQQEQIFEQSVDDRPATKDGANNEYVFYDGPPFANGLPHHGHLLTGFVKDLFARYHTMKGQRVERRFGWDCHGLPAEMEAEKGLKISGRKNIIDFGIDKFNDYCRTSVMTYAGEWRDYVNRQARWVDFDNDYKTMDTNFMESVIWAFSELNKKGLVYEGFKVMPYSWAAETVLSSSEIRLDDATREKEDKAVTVRFKLKDKPKGAPDAQNYYILAWTTTPWTLPSNLGLAAGKEVQYTTLTDAEGKNCYVMGAFALEGLQKQITPEEDGMTTPINGADLIGLQYEPLFPYFQNTENAFRILDGSDFVEEGSGTGIVHMAPGFGEDDQRVCAEQGIETIVPVDGEGRYMDAIYDIDAMGRLDMVETERCILRAPTPEDEKHFVALHTNEQVMDTMNDGVMSEEEAKADFAKNLEHFKKHGYGQWVVFHKESGEFMGRAGLTYYAQSEEVEPLPTLRCGLMPEFWHGGYGSEVCIASLRFGFIREGLELIAGGAVPHNPRAHKMLERIGLKHLRDVKFKRMVGPYYQITRDAFAELHGLPESNTVLTLKGLNVIKETKGQREDEPFKPEQVEKYGLANLRIIKWLKSNGRLIKEDVIKHNYPHCWRTDEPIIYKAMSSWFVDVPKIRDRMVELNQEINWIPHHIKDGRFGKWIANAREWSISRSRFWGCPIPVWRSDNPENEELYVFGSIKELEEFFNVKVEDLHRPFIDTLTKPDPTNPDYTIKRVEDVFDCWFESGSMPYAQVHYPFENKEWFENHFPADFIVEYEAQTRGWFYNMYVLSVALFDRIPFKNCICHGVVLDDQGRKLSKRLKNYMDPRALFDQYGSDALRWFMMSSTIMRGNELLLDPEGKFIHDAIRLYIKPIWNAYHFFTLYANADGIQGKFDVSSENLMDRYILAKCAEMVKAVERSLDDYDTPAATQAVTVFVEVLNNWYIRRNKERFWKSEKDADKQAAYDTLFTVLHVMCRAIAPLLPMVTDKIYQGLTGEKSVHLADFPDVNEFPNALEDRPSKLLATCESGYMSFQEMPMSDNAILHFMDRVRDICSIALAIRSEKKIRVRQPLLSLTYYGHTGQVTSEFFSSIIKDEVNVHSMHFGSQGITEVADYKLKLNNQILGKRLPEKMKQIIPASKKGEWEMKDGALIICGETLLPEEYEMNLEPKQGVEGAQALSTNDALVVLDLTITPELEAEGKARDLVRMIQQARKDAGLNISDRIHLVLDVPESASGAVDQFADYIAKQTLAVNIEQSKADKATHKTEQTLDGEPVVIGFSVEAVAA